MWLQPVNQGFYDQSGKLGGAIEMVADYNIGRGFSANITGGYKTEGWMIGNPISRSEAEVGFELVSSLWTEFYVSL